MSETVKANEVTAPTIFIGVGGIGCDVVKRVAEKCQPEETKSINFVCLDTDANDLRSVKKSNANIYYVQTSNTQTVGDYLDYDEDARENWFPNNAVLYDKTVSEGAGQVRAISRLAFDATIKTGNINPLFDAVDNLFLKTGEDLKQALRVIYVSSASGGTGSGMLLPLTMYLRDYVNDKYPNTAMIARGLIILPEALDSVISSTQEKNSQYRNAYATIKELNAFMMEGSGFFDVDEDLKRYKNLKIDYPLPNGGTKSLALLPMDFCFLMDGQNSKNEKMKNLDQYKEQAAQALYEQNIGPMRTKASSVEDNIIKELANPGNVGRNRFGGIGASILRYPYEDLADYVAYSWALDNIGGEGDVGKWGRYDKEYDMEAAEAKKKGLPVSEGPTRGQVYSEALSSGKDAFSKDIRNEYDVSPSEANKRVNKFVSSIVNQVVGSVEKDTGIKAAAERAMKLGSEIDYMGDDKDEQGQAEENLDTLRRYEQAVKKSVVDVADREADAIFYNDTKTVNVSKDKQEYMVEALLKNGDNIAHPVAARYLLYLARDKFKSRRKAAQSEVESAESTFELYSADGGSVFDAGVFDAGYTHKAKEGSIDELCAVEKENPSIIDKLGGYKKIYDQFNEHFVAYYNAIRQYLTAKTEYCVCEEGYEFLNKICSEYERFFFGFSSKAEELQRRKDDLADSIAYKEGDSVRNICSEREVMDELVTSTSKMSVNGAMLDSELNGAIYDAVKANVSFEREIAYEDIVEEDKRVDIFDDIILEYFRNSVRDECKSMDVNIVEAIALEYRLSKRASMRNGGESGSQIVDHISHDDTVTYIEQVISGGGNLASANVQEIQNEEARKVRCVAYNESLDEMRNYRVKELFENGVNGMGCDSISKYEMHFYTATYNITPDKLAKFACPKKRKTRTTRGGCYYDAYNEYSKYLGPDSTKNMMISTHINKRWDSIAFMPEIDLDFLNQKMMKIHKNFIYALLYGLITQKQLFQEVGGKDVYRYTNSQDREEELIVSNGTYCDEFYEILDSLYIDAAVVEDIDRVRAAKEKEEGNSHKFEDTAFAVAVDDFALKDAHEGKVSLFEIPIVYYNSLPSSRRFNSEISTMVDAVMQIIVEGIQKVEMDSGKAKGLLCKTLYDQFMMMIGNYNDFASMNGGVLAVDNTIIDMIFRKIQDAFNEDPAPKNTKDLLEEMRAKIKERIKTDSKESLAEFTDEGQDKEQDEDLDEKQNK